MKYAVFTKKIGELDVSDFDEEVLNQYENLTLRKEGLSYTINGQEVITTTDNLIQDMCERQIELIFNDFAERVAKKMHKVLEQESSKDLISRKEVINGLEYKAEMLNRALDTLDNIYVSDQEHKKITWGLELIKNFIKDIKELPSKEQKRGKWVDRASELDAGLGRHNFVCSECAHTAWYFVGGSENWWDTKKPNYCPNCGAKMEVEEC